MKDDTAEVLSIEGREVRVTHPDKPYFSKQTKLSKLDLVRYYLSVAPGALAERKQRGTLLTSWTKWKTEREYRGRKYAEASKTR
jgi:bifunctional non-homologous end joining protein LigD